MSILRRGPALLVMVVLFLMPGTLPASAHVRDTTGYSTVEGHGRIVSYSLSLEYEMLARAVDLGSEALAAADDRQRQSALDAGRTKLQAYLAERVAIFLDDAACEPALEGSHITKRESTPYAQLDLRYSCPGSSGAYVLKYTVFSATDAAADDHTNIVDYRLGGQVGRTVLDDRNPQFTVGAGSFASSSARFVGMGVEHVLSGLDHVLFILALLLGAASVRKLVGVVSMFTVAHSLTLISALLGGVRVPEGIVEPLIALSIAFVATENLLGATRRRLPVVFVFGLLHGLGFAGSLRVADEVSGNLIASLLSFNIGIEAGQALLLLVAFPLLLLVRRSRLSVPAQRGATVVVAGFGLLWFIERLSLA